MCSNNEAKMIAMYFPQFHEIKENNEWWGAGFTDWVNVKNALPLFDGHNQPRIPSNKNYYDQSQIDTLRWQIDLANRYGIYGFCHYHYWFDGKQLLETPTNLMLDNKDLNIKFCLSWANETWSRRWDGRNHQILVKQTHPPQKNKWKKHFDYLIKAWSDDRSIKIDGKPVFIIYRPHRINKVGHMLNYWRELAHQNGLKGLYFIAQKQYEFPRRDCLENFDAIFQFQPFESISSPLFDKHSIKQTPMFKLFCALPEQMQDLLRLIYSRFVNKPTFYDYDQVWRSVVEIHNDPQLTTFPGAFVDWDNTARYKNRALIFKSASPDRFEYWLRELLNSMPKRELPEPFIFLNAWNEWSESTYLEPDENHGLAYLEAVREAISQKQLDPV